MSKHGTWTVVFEDKIIIKRTGEFNKQTACAHTINDDNFWNQSKFNNLHAIQFTDDNLDNDQVEFNDNSPNGLYDAAIYGDFSQFITKWDEAHLAEIQSDWDNNNISVEDPVNSGMYRDETNEEKVSRLGERPVTYSS